MNKIVPIASGVIVCETEYPSLGLKYFGVKYYNFTLKCFDIIFIEQSQLNKLQNPKEDEVSTHTHSYLVNSEAILK